MAEASSSGGNALLNAFPADVRTRLVVESKVHKGHEGLIRGDQRAEFVYFPHRGCVISLTRSIEGGSTVEVGIVGSEGLVDVQKLLAPDGAGADAVVQIAGCASRVRLLDLRQELNDNAAVRDLLLESCGAFLAQVSQHAVCNRMHSIEQRLAKWLLAVRDRIDSDEIGLTQDFLSQMLGTRRAGVTVAVGTFTLDGLVKHGRSSITIIDRAGLEESACECYLVIHDAIRHGKGHGQSVQRAPRSPGSAGAGYPHEAQACVDENALEGNPYEVMSRARTADTIAAHSRGSRRLKPRDHSLRSR